jgi:hypothetical protein
MLENTKTEYTILNVPQRKHNKIIISYMLKLYLLNDRLMKNDKMKLYTRL